MTRTANHVTVHHRLLPINGINLHVAEAGPADGPLVILLHGYPDFWWGWRNQIGTFAASGYRIVAPDMRGYNESDKPRGVKPYQLDTLARDVVALADAYQSPRFRLAGHDWGGLVAWWTGVRYPDRIEKLAILNAPHPDAWSQVVLQDPMQLLKSWYVGWFQIPLLPEATLSAGNFALPWSLLTGSSRAGAFDAQDRARYTAAWRKPYAQTAMINYYRALRSKPHDGPHRVTPPTLVLWGAKDISLQRGNLDASLALCDRGRGILFPEASHWLHREFPAQVNSALLRFWKSA